MSADRMRRVDEAVREVLSDAITHELKDPRVGFVTVTAVETAPDLRHARVFVSRARRRRRAPALADGPAVGARLPAARVARELRLKHTPTLEFVYDDTTDRASACRLIASERGEAEPATRRRARREHAQRRQASRELVLDELRDGERFVLTTHEHPDGDALGSLAAMQQVLCALGKDAVSFMSADEFPLPYEYRFLELDRSSSPRRPTTSTSARSSSWTAATSTATRRTALKRAGARILNIDHHHDNTRFGTVNHVVPDASCTAEIVWDLMRRARRAADAGDRRGAVRRPGHRHRQVHVREHRLARARHGGGADRRRDRRARDLPAPVRGHPAGQARAARARAVDSRALRRRRC